MMYSNNFGISWNSQTSPTVFNKVPVENSPYTTTLFPGSGPNFADSNFVMQGLDDGTLGYDVANNRVLNANSYIYGISNALTSNGEGVSAAGDSYYLWRIPRAQFADFNPSEYQFFIGGDGTQASAWSGTQSAATAILTNDCNGTALPAYPGCLGNPSFVYIPALNRYLLATYYWVNGVNNPASTVMLFYDSPTPWGPFTQVGTASFPTQGYYVPAIVHADALAATFASTRVRILFTSEYTGDYSLQYATMTVSH